MSIIDCEQQPVEQRLAYWRRSVGSLFPRAQVKEADKHGFKGTIEWRRGGCLTISHISSVAQIVSRSAADVDADRADVFELNIRKQRCGVASGMPMPFALCQSMHAAGRGIFCALG